MTAFTQVSQGNYVPTEGMKELLRRWFYLKFVQKMSTVELMATASDLRNKSALSIVALLVHIPAHHEHPFRTNVNTYSGST